MRKKDKIKKKISNYFFDHHNQYVVINYSLTSIVSLFSGMIFAFGFATFISVYDSTTLTLGTGGFSGFTQSIVLILKQCGVPLESSLLQSIFYFVFNIPALLFAFFKIGRKFAITSAVNVGLSSLFISLFSSWFVVRGIALSPYITNSPLSRVLFAGICTGISSGLALKAGSSCGGMDIVSAYLSVRKSTGVGKYNIIANTFVVLFYTVVNVAFNPENYVNALLIVPYAFVYFLISSLVIDVIHIKNKKIEVEIITKNDYMTDILLSIFPHGSTILEGKGAYSHESKHIIKMIVSSYEVRKVVNTVKKIDPDSFVSLIPLQQVYGNFFINPVE